MQVVEGDCVGKSKAGGRVFVDFSLEKEVGSKKGRGTVAWGRGNTG